MTQLVHPQCSRRPSGLFLAAVLVLSLFLGAACSPAKDLHILVIPALKGQIFTRSTPEGRSGGISLISAWKRKLQAQGSEVILAAAGNTISGSPAAFVTQGDMVFRCLEEMGTQILFMDAREFTFGQERLKELARSSKVPLSAANLEYERSEESSWYTHDWYDAQSRTLLIGLVGPYFMQKSLDEHTRGFSVIPALEAVKTRLDTARLVEPGPGHVGVIALSHRVQNDGAGYLWEVASLDGVDFVIQGGMSKDVQGLHEKSRGPGMAPARIYVVDSDHAEQGERLVDISLGAGNSLSARMLEVSESVIDPDAQLKDFLYKSHAVIDSMLGDRVTGLTGDLAHRDDGESALGDLVCDFMRMQTGSDVSFINSGSLRRGLKAGPVTLDSLYAIMPFGGNLVESSFQGSALLAMLDRSLGFMAKRDQGRGFLQVSGLELRYRVGKDGVILPLLPGDVLVGGMPLEPDRWYRCCTELFVSSGGDGYAEAAHARNQVVHSVSIISEFRDWLARKDSWAVPEGGRIHHVPVGMH